MHALQFNYSIPLNIFGSFEGQYVHEGHQQVEIPTLHEDAQVLLPSSHNMDLSY